MVRNLIGGRMNPAALRHKAQWHWKTVGMLSSGRILRTITSRFRDLAPMESKPGMVASTGTMASIPQSQNWQTVGSFSTCFYGGGSSSFALYGERYDAICAYRFTFLIADGMIDPDGPSGYLRDYYADIQTFADGTFQMSWTSGNPDDGFSLFTQRYDARWFGTDRDDVIEFDHANVVADARGGNDDVTGYSSERPHLWRRRQRQAAWQGWR